MHIEDKRAIIGEKIASLRKNLKLTQKELANKIGEHSSYISRWENGKLDLDVPQLYKLADFFRVPIIYLLGEEITSTNGNSNIGRIIKRKRKQKEISLYDISSKLKGAIEPIRLSEIEEGVTTPTPNEIEAISEVIGVDKISLLRDDEKYLEEIRKYLFLLDLDESVIEAVEQHIKFNLNNKKATN